MMMMMICWCRISVYWLSWSTDSSLWHATHSAACRLQV